MKESEVPKQEIALFREGVLSRPEYFDVNYINQKYTKYCSEVIPDPFDLKVVKLIKEALKEKTPFSLIRLGDGEVNLLTYLAYPNTPNLNYLVAEQSVNKRAHSFNVSDHALNKLAGMMLDSVLSADILGLLGVWRFKPVTAEQFLSNNGINLRGMVGHWRGLDFMLKMSERKTLNHNLVVSAHCYFSIIEHLDCLLSELEKLKIIVINNQPKSAVVLSNKYPNIKVKHISLDESQRPLIYNTPYFLDQVSAKLPEDLSGVLVLIGAGPWAELYCHRVKERGGVAVDFGTGLDLLVGKKTRPIHRKIKFNHQFDEGLT